MFPICEPAFNGVDDSFEKAEVAVMETEAAREFPDPFDRVQFGTMRWQKVQAELRRLLHAPIQM